MLSYKIYQIMELGWLNMSFKLQGIRQTKNMLNTCRPEDIIDEQDAWPKVPEKFEY